MKIAMGTLAVLALVGGVVQLPFGATNWLDEFLAPTFDGSKFYETLQPSDSFTLASLLVGTVLGLAGIGAAYFIWVARPGTAARIQARFAPLHRLFVNKWYFDELIDLVVVRPFAWVGRFGQQTFERVVVNGAIVGGASGVVRAGSAAARALQSGFLRAYAGLLLFGLLGVTLYFLLQS